MKTGHTHWDYDGDGQFKRLLAWGKQARYARKWFVKVQKKQMDDPGEEK